MKEIDCIFNSVSCLFVGEKSTFYELNVTIKGKTGRCIIEKISNSYKINVFVPVKFSRIAHVEMTISLIFMEHVASKLV